MVKSALKGMSRAFTMIELVYAIVIIAITMLTIPMVMQVNASNQEGSLFQEGILITSTKISQALTFPWDQNSPPLGGIMSFSNVLNTNSVTAGMGRVNDINGNPTDFRVGHFQESLRRRLSSSSFPRGASAIVADNSIANQHGLAAEDLGVGTQDGYKKRWSVTTNVSYVPDFTDYTQTGIVFNFDTNLTALGAGVTSNIKMIQVTATDISVGSNNDQIQLTSFSSNIGETEFFKRRY